MAHRPQVGAFIELQSGKLKEPTGAGGATPAGMTWDATPKLSGMATPTPKRQRSRWDETPAIMGSATPLPGATPAVAYTPGVTHVGGTDEELDAMFPQEGYEILEPPASYVPIRTPARKFLITPTPLVTPLYQIPEENRRQHFDVPKEVPGGGVVPR
ncbi:uncharacterized protein HKW66_Vig0066650 [Vigna angularis]|uniref:Splicing factor 3B subunit 1 domain-containing protein n=1 Tax=Phaseolus angularis TaxID=3914 RepID=A0A8T0K9M4_PHAAN|nr:uncharacterized protein HKW66_Vig0066650 [Vigna angularis]